MSIIISDVNNTLLMDRKVPNTALIDFLNKQSSTIILVTGSDESKRDKISRRLEASNLNYSRMYMNNSNEDDDVFKYHMAQDLLRTDEVVLAVDNSSSARRAYASLGIRVSAPENIDNMSKYLLWQSAFDPSKYIPRGWSRPL
jgi:hydroxymethylpyrimidine pyrophosphatase-like HAD family hydrolase